MNFFELYIKLFPKKDKPLVLCGNKIDLVDRRAVSQQEGEALAEKYGATYLEVSAKSGFNVPDAFNTLIDRL